MPKASKLRSATGSRFAAAGRRAAEHRRLDTREKCRTAIRGIEKDVQNNSGLYPYNKGRITLQEVLRRAGLSAGVLEKPQHRDLKDGIAERVRNANKQIVRGARSIRRNVNTRVLNINEDLGAIRQAWAEAELEHAECRAKVADLTLENATLKNQIRALRLRLETSL